MGNFFGGSSSGSSPTRYAGIQVSTSIMGQVIPLVMGRNRVPMNLMWYGGFTSTPVKSGGNKGGSAPSSYQYATAFQAGLCLGPIVGVISVWSDKTATTLTYENLTLALGSIGQAVWSGYPTGTPTNQQIPYSSTAWVGSQDFVLGSSPAMPNFTYEIEGAVAGFSDAHGMYDCDPPSIITAYLTNPVWGAGFTGAIAPMTGATNTYQAWCGAQGIFLSPIEDNQRSATDFMAELMQITNSDLVLSCGTLKVVPYADAPISATTPDGTTWSYAPNLTPVFQFTDKDYFPKPGEDPVMLDRKASTDIYNMVSVEYVDRANQYNPTPAPAQDNADIARRGPRPMSQLSFHQITQASVARTVAQLILQFQLYERNTYTFRVRWPYSLVEPMDYIAITEANLGLVNQVCRVIETQDDENNEFTIKCMKVTGTIRTTALFNWAGSQGYYANFGAAPPNVDTPAIFQMPAIPASLSEGITIGIAVSNPNATTNWGGCYVNLSLDGGSTYAQVGTIGSQGPANYGTLTSNLGAVADPDTTSSFGILLDNTANQISTAVTHANADAMLSLALIGSGTNTEVIAYGSATLTGAGAYTLSYLRRGLFGTTPLANTTGARFVNLDGALFELALDPGQAGGTLNFKFQSFNSVGNATEALSSCTAYTYTIPVANPVSGIATLVPRGSCAISAQTVYKATTASAAWDSDCVSSKPYSSISVSGQYGSSLAASPLTALGIGLATSVASTLVPGTSAGYYAISVNTSVPNVSAYAGTTLLYSSSSLSRNDLYQVTYDGFTVRYYINGVSVASIQAQGLSLYVGISEYTPGCSLSNVETTVGALATPSQFVAVGNCVVNDTNAMKQGGSSAWDSAIYSVIGYPTCHITAKPNNAGSGGRFMVGLTTAAGVAAGPSYSVMLYGLFNDGAPGWQVYEAGAVVFTGPAASINDVAAVTYDGTSITYFINGIAIYSHGTTTNLTLYGFCPFFDAGAGLNTLRFGPSTSLALPVTGGAALLTPRGTCVLNGQMLTKLTAAAAWDGDAYSAQSYSAGAIQVQNRQTGGNTTIAAVGFITSVPGSPAAQPDSTTGFYGIYPHGGSSIIEICVNGANVLSLGPASDLDLYLVTYDGFTFRYYVNNVLEWTAQAQVGPVHFYLPFYGYGNNQGFVDLQLTTSAQSAPSQWVCSLNAGVSDSHFQKTGGTVGWDAWAYSVIGYGQCHIGAKISPALTANVMFGLTVAPQNFPAEAAGINDYVVLNAGWYSNPAGNWQIYESGTLIGTYNAESLTDAPFITYDGTYIRYFMNDPNQSAPVRAVNVGGGLTFYGAVVSYSQDGGWNNIDFGPTTNPAIIDTGQVGSNAVSQVISTTVSGLTQFDLTVAGTTTGNTISASGTFTGAPVGIDFSATLDLVTEHFSFNSPMTVYITRDGTTIGVANFDIYTWQANVTPAVGFSVSTWSTPIALIVNDSPSAGSHTYAATFSGVQGTYHGPGTPVACNVNFINQALKVREYKK